MKFKRTNTYIYGILLLIIVGFTACEDNELDVNADWKETIVVYGLLDVNADTQFVRIQKAYLNPDQDALEIAQIADSLYFKNLQVLLINMRTGGSVELGKVDYQKDTGVFASQPNILYYTTDVLEVNDRYKLQITNIESGNVVTAETDLVRDASAFSPIPNNIVGTFHLPPTEKLDYYFTTGLNARIYDMNIRFYYREIKIDGSDSVTKHFDWPVSRNRRLGSSTKETRLLTKVEGPVFYNYIITNIAEDETVNRRLLFCDISYIGGSDELDLYLSVNRPSIGIVQKKPEYTNVNNGLGLFSSRNNKTINDVSISQVTKDYLVNRPEVSHLNFVK